MKYFFLERPKTSFLILILITFFLAIPISQIEIETNIASYLPRDVEVMETLALVGEDWATENYIILIKSDNVFDREVQEEILRIESEINPDKNDGGIRDSVVSTMSLASLSSTFSADGLFLDTKTIFSLIPEELKNMLVSEDEKQTVIIVGIYPYADIEDLINRIDSVLESTSLDTSVTGTALLSREIVEWASGKLYIVWMVILFLFLVIYYFHRTLKSIIICLLPSLFAAIQTYGILGLSNLTLTTEIVILVAPMSLALGVNYGVYLMERFSSTRGNDRKERLYTTINTTGKAILLSATTTAIGFIALTSGILPSVRVLGVALAIAISLTFFSTVVVVPVLILMLKYEKKGKEGGWKKLSKFPFKHAKAIIIAVLLLSMLSLLTINKISTNADYMEMAPKTIPSIRTMIEYSEGMGSSAQPNMILVEGDVMNVSAIGATNDLINELKSIENVSAIGLPTIYGMIWQMVPLLPGMYGPFPTEQWQINIMTHLMESFAGNETLSTFISGDKSMILVNTPMLEMDESEEIVNRIGDTVSKTTIPHCRVSNLTGTIAINVEINNTLMKSQTRSLFASFIAIFIVTILIFRSLRFGALAVLPPFFVVLFEPLLLFVFDIPLDLITISIGSIMMGIGVDYGIQIMQRTRDEGGGKEGMERSIRYTGLALTEAVATEIIGIMPTLLIEISAIREFILLLMCMIFLVYIFAAFFLPACYSLGSNGQQQKRSIRKLTDGGEYE
jgi:hypothetical protein